MCGICGFTGSPDEKLINRMTDIMIHRGPDDRGIFINEGISLGHRRLSIIDLSSGHQPMFNEDKSICIVYNGEIYNYIGLKDELQKKGHSFRTDSDTEVIIHMYEEMGMDCVQRLNGMFSFGIWDDNKKRLFLARDRLGIKPLYYTEVNNRFLFASEIKSLLQYDNLKREVNYSALDQLLSFSFVSGNETMFKGIYRLSPGHVLIYEKGRTRINRYWQYESDVFREVNEENIIEQIYETLKDAVNIRLMSDVPLGATLSGGLDSSVVVGIMSGILNRPVKSFTVGFNEVSDELPYARIVANQFKTDHKEYIVKYDHLEETLPEIIWHLEEPITHSAIIPTYYYSKALKKDTTVTLVGEGADELFAGYIGFKYMSPLLGLIPNVIKHYASLSNLSTFTERQKKHLFTRESREKLDGSTPLSDYYKYFHNKNSNLDNSLLFYIEKVLPEYNLMRIDKMTMCHSVEARVPFLDYRLAELASRIPSSLKLKGFEEKYILRKSLRNLLPQEILDRPKRGLNTPVKSWFDRGLNYYIDTILSEDSINRMGLFEKKQINHIVKNKNQFILGRKYRYQILKLIFIGLWFDVFIDKKYGFESSFPDDPQQAST